MGGGFRGVPGADDVNGGEDEEDEKKERSADLTHVKMEMDALGARGPKDETSCSDRSAGVVGTAGGQWTVSLELDGEAFRLRVPRRGVDSTSELKRAVVEQSLTTVGPEATPQPWLEGELSTMAIQFIHAEVCARGALSSTLM